MPVFYLLPGSPDRGLEVDFTHPTHRLARTCPGARHRDGGVWDVPVRAGENRKSPSHGQAFAAVRRPSPARDGTQTR